MIKTLLKKIHVYKSLKLYRRIMPCIRNANSILDIGSGVGTLSEIIKKTGKEVIALDVDGYKWPRINTPILYDGNIIPFKDKIFDRALLITVMHHTENPEQILKEANRVAKEIVIIETSYKNKLHKLLTIIFDTLVNMQKDFYWNSYHSDKEWGDIFLRNRLLVKHVEKYWDFYNLGIPLFHITYHLVALDKLD